MHHLASPPYSPSLSTDDSAMSSVVSSSSILLDQPPPPTLREILAAYKAKGDGDREMLLAMLNAKTAEDQRIANSAALYRSLLDLHRDNLPSFQHLNLPPPHHHHSQNSPNTRESPPRVSLPPIREHISHPSSSSSESSSSSSDSRRKRPRLSPQPHIDHFNDPSTSTSSPPRDLPPSPDSSVSHRSFSSESSIIHLQRERGAITIGSLLSQSRSQDHLDEIRHTRDETPRTATTHPHSHSRKSSSSL